MQVCSVHLNDSALYDLGVHHTGAKIPFQNDVSHSDFGEENQRWPELHTLGALYKRISDYVARWWRKHRPQLRQMTDSLVRPGSLKECWK